MDNNLWIKISAFDMDYPVSEYGFSTRIANENYWTIHFTEKAILEYKKFMYLAAVSELMVSPSEIVDIVWHEHLIFTQSYQDLCNITGKKIEHIPSTHNRQDFQKFKLAKDRTTKLYEATFGSQPADIWNSSGMFEPLSLKKSKIKLRTLLLLGVLVFLALVLPFFVILKPIYTKIENPYFVIGFIILSILSGIFLEGYNNKKLSAILSSWDKNLFIFNLSPMELIFLRKRKLANVIHGCVNQLVEEKKINISDEQTLTAGSFSEYTNVMEYSVLETLKSTGTVNYPVLLSQLLLKPAFGNVAGPMDAFKKYILKSKPFVKLFLINFMVLSTIFLLGFVRLLTGILRDRPVIFILFALILYALCMAACLSRVVNLLPTTLLPSLYKTSIVPAVVESERWRWNYFLFGNSTLTEAFVPLVSYTERNNNSASNSWGDSCGSSCGSSCSSCGGCGGD